MKLTKDRIEENTSEEQKPFEVKSKFWLNRKVFTDIFGKKSISFDRNLVKDAFRSGNYQKAILITLAWGYPKAMRRFKPNEENIMLIKEILEGNRNLSKAELYQKFGGLSQIEGLGTSTLTKLLFFSGFTYKNIPCLILDQRVQDSMENYEDFEKIDTGSTNPTVNNYISYLEKINELTNHFGIPEEKIELFLYNQVWKEK